MTGLESDFCCDFQTRMCTVDGFSIKFPQAWKMTVLGANLVTSWYALGHWIHCKKSQKNWCRHLNVLYKHPMYIWSFTVISLRPNQDEKIKMVWKVVPVLVAVKSIWTPCFCLNVNQITSGKLWTWTRCTPDLNTLCRTLPYLAIAKIFD